MSEHPSGASPSPPGDDERPGEVTRRGAAPEEVLRQLNAEITDLEVLRHLGDESFGSLFLARDLTLPRKVVVKVLRRDYVGNEEARRRFEREARAVARIEHPNVVSVFDVDTLASGIPYFKEPWLGDCTLRTRLESVGRFQPAEVRRILRQLASALLAAHRAGIVHRDVRPETVRCEGERTDRLLLADFGIAGILESASLDEHRITSPGEVLGSPGYMSPEQRGGEPATDRSDVYSLGVLGWELLTGSPEALPSPERGMDRSEMLRPAPDDPELIDLIVRCLRPSPGDRPDAESLVRELERSSVMQGTGRHWHRTPLTELFERWVPLFAIGMIGAAMGFAAFLVDLITSPPRVRAFVLIFLATVFLEALVITVYHGRRGRQAVTRTEMWLLRGIAVVGAAAMLAVWLVMPTT